MHTRMNTPNALRQLGCACILHHKPARPSGESTPQVPRSAEGRHNERTYRLAGERHQFRIPNRSRHINTAGKLRTGHFDIEKHHIRVIPVDRRNNLIAAANLRDHLNIVLKSQQRGQRLAHKLLVIGEHNLNHLYLPKAQSRRYYRPY